MRLLITTDTVGGVWTFTSTLTQELLQRGHTVHLVSFGRAPSSDQQAWAEVLSSRPSTGAPTVLSSRPSTGAPTVISTGGVAGAERSASSASARQPRFTYTPTSIPLEWMQHNEQAFERGQDTLLQALSRHPADLILSSQFCFGRLDTQIPRIVVAHSDVLSWAEASKPSALEPTPWLHRYTAMVQSGLLEASAVITPTNWMGKALAANFFLPHRYLVIPNGTSVEPTPGSEPPRKLQAITAGRLWDEAKGLDALRDLDPPLPLLVAGDNRLTTTDQQAAWPAHVENLGPLSRPALHQRFRESALYLCTSRYEPFGLAPLEAALCGCAILANDLPSLREVWGDAALFYTGQAGLRLLLNSLVREPAQLAQAQRKAAQRAALLTAGRMTSSYLHLFETMLQQQAQKAHVA